jgi:hypothetical protein
MDASAPVFLQALEQSVLGATIRQATWIYPLANIGHVLAVIVFAGVIAVMDVRLAGAFQATAPRVVVGMARRIAVVAFAFIALTGSIMFIAEASHLALNRVFQIKVLLIVLGLLNVIAFQLAFGNTIEKLPGGAPLPGAVRYSAFASLGIWLLVAACGRSIAYF